MIFILEENIVLFWVSQVIKIIFLFVQDSSISYFIHCYDKTLDKSSLREESFVWAHGLRRDTAHHGRKDSAGSIEWLLRVHLCSECRERWMLLLCPFLHVFLFY